MQESPGMNGNLVAFIDVRRLELYLKPMLLKETNIFLRSQRTYIYRPKWWPRFQLETGTLPHKTTIFS